MYKTKWRMERRKEGALHREKIVFLFSPLCNVGTLFSSALSFCPFAFATCRSVIIPSPRYIFFLPPLAPSFGPRAKFSQFTTFLRNFLQWSLTYSLAHSLTNSLSSYIQNSLSPFPFSVIIVFLTDFRVKRNPFVAQT